MAETSNPSWLRRFYQSRAVSFLLGARSLAVILGTAAFFILPFTSDPYQFSLIDSSSFVADPNGYREFYLDLNSNGFSDRFYISNVADSNSALTVKTPAGGILDQWNFKGRLSVGLLFLQQSDFDHNGKKEISVVSNDNGKVHLNIIEPYGSASVKVLDFLIDTISTQYKSPSPIITDFQSTDLNDDGFDEILFCFSVTAARQPRKVYAYDLKNGTLKSSPYAGNFNSEITWMDADHDGIPEIAGRCTAPFNYTDEIIELQDSFSWYIIYDQSLKFKVPPIKMGPMFSETATIKLPQGDGVASFVFTSGNQDSIPVFKWFRVMEDYSIKEEAFANQNIKNPYSFVYPACSRGGMFYNRSDKVLFVNASGKFSTVSGFPKRVMPMKILNAEAGPREFEYCLAVDGPILNLAFYSLEGKKLGLIEDINYADLNGVCWAGKVDGKYRIFISGATLWQWFELQRNPWQYLRYLIWLGLIAAIYGFIMLIRFGQAQELLNRESLRRQILELQLKTVKNQLDPHFTFNALNGLSYLAMAGDTARVNEFINHFSRLLRTHMVTSDQTLIKLKSEIDFLENFMELQRMRYDDKIRMDLEVHPDLNTNMLVPKMILQTHVENALKHGLRPKMVDSNQEIGVVKVTIYPEKDKTIIQIEDNGVGRGNGQNPVEESTGKGLQVLEQIFSSVKQLYKIVITQEFKDLLNDQGKPIGTRVKIVIQSL